MNLRKLGSTGLMVSPLCFGTLTIGPVQRNFSPDKGAALICQAYEAGVNFFDTAELYDTYKPLKIALRQHPDLIIAGRSYAASKEEMRRSLDLARKQLDRDYIDIFGIHELENAASLKGHQAALDYLTEAKSKGIIKGVEISTHYIAGVRAGATDPRIDIIHPLINLDGIGIRDGSVNEMVEAIKTAKEFGKGIYAMKVLAGGHLIDKAAEAIRFIVDLDLVDSLAIGIQSITELKINLALINREPIPSELSIVINQVKRTLEIASWCQGCGSCVEKCSFEALSMVGNRPVVDQGKCVRCGYCARVCPEFCLKIV